MAFDGITTACLTKEFSDRLTGARITKIAQTESDELLLTLKPAIEKGGGQCRLYMSANPSLPLCYLTEISRQAPLTAPSFCMLLRKHLMNGKIVSVSQPALERVIRFEIEHYNEMGDLCTHTLLIEIMGKHSNIILIDENNVITDSIRHVSAMVSSVREVLPGRTYFIPETQNKIDPLTDTQQEFTAAMAHMDIPAASWLTRRYMGMSTLMAEEICFRAALVTDRAVSALTAEDEEKLWNAFSAQMERVKEGIFEPVVYYSRGGDAAPGEPADFSAAALSMYGDLEQKSYDSMSLLLESYYEEKNVRTRIRQKSADLRKTVSTILERDVHKYDRQSKQMADTQKKDRFRICGELLNAYAYSIPEGAESAVVDNYYTGEKMKITLDPTRSANQNAVRYFEKYTKLKRTAEALEDLMKEVKAEIDQLRSIQTALDIATTEGDLEQIREELVQGGFVRHRTEKKGKSRTPAGRPLHYISSDGYDIFVGKNNLQNEEVTFKMASGSDIWFHANDIPGSHVILKSGGKAMNDIPDRAFEEAASLAAFYSSGKEQEKVEIDYLERKNVKKPSGARPGFVVYYTNYSIIASTDISGLRMIKEGQ